MLGPAGILLEEKASFGVQETDVGILMEVVLVVQHQVRPQHYLCSKGSAGACWYPPGGGDGPTERSPAQAPALRHRELLGAAGSCREQEMQLPEYPHTTKSSPWEGRRPGHPRAEPTGTGLGAAGSCWVPLGPVSSWKYTPSQHRTLRNHVRRESRLWGYSLLPNGKSVLASAEPVLRADVNAPA